MNKHIKRPESLRNCSLKRSSREDLHLSIGRIFFPLVYGATVEEIATREEETDKMLFGLVRLNTIGKGLVSDWLRDTDGLADGSKAVNFWQNHSQRAWGN